MSGCKLNPQSCYPHVASSAEPPLTLDLTILVEEVDSCLGVSWYIESGPECTMELSVQSICLVNVCCM